MSTRPASPLNPFEPRAETADALHGIIASLRYRADVCGHPYAARDIRSAIADLETAERRLRTEHHS